MRYSRRSRGSRRPTRRRRSFKRKSVGGLRVGYRF